MNERALWRHRRLVLRGMASVLALIIGWYGYTQLVDWANRAYGVQHIRISFTDVFDKKMPAAIEHWFDERKAQGDLQKKAHEELAQTLLQSFPLVRKVSWGTYIPGYLHCTVVGVRPTFLINDCYLAGNNGRLYQARDFAEYDEAIPCLQISKNWLNKTVFSGVHRFFAELDSRLLRTYNLYYHDPYTIALVPVSLDDLPHRCVCLVDEQSAARVRTLSELMDLCHDLKERMKQNTHDAICFFDFRFKDRIISRIIPQGEFAQLQRVHT